MQMHGDKPMGRFSVDLEVTNYRDMIEAELGHLANGKVRRITIKGVVDSGAARFVLPESVVRKLGLSATSKVRVRYADGRTAKRPQVENVYLELLGRHGVFKATVEPNRETALIGAIVLEDLDFLVDCTKQQLYPRDPDFVVAEIE